MQSPVPVVPGALIIEAVPDLVTNNSTNRTIINSRIDVRSKERCLQNCCRESNLVRRRTVVSIHSLRSHVPLRVVYRFANLSDLAVEIELRHLLR